MVVCKVDGVGGVGVMLKEELPIAGGSKNGK